MTTLRRFAALLFLGFGIAVVPGFVYGMTADEILQRADDIRMPSGDYLLKIEAVSRKTGGSDEDGTYNVLLKGKDHTLIETLAPKTDYGTSFLMVQRDLWVFVQDVSKPVRISLQQRLLGEISNGDLARANFVGDYTPTLAQTTPQLYILRLDAKSDDVTYGRVILAVDRKTFRPLKAKFYTSSGKLLKSGSYEGYKPMAGETRPTRLVFTSALQAGHVSVLTYKDMLPQADLPDKMFTKDYLKKLKY